MRNISFYFLSMLTILYSCSNKKEEAASINKTTASDSVQVHFFPVTAFIKGQLMELDSIQLTPLQVITQAKKIDSNWISKKDIRPLLQDFISSEINETNMLEFFNVTKFNDQSTGAITFTYNPKTNLPDRIELRHWDVYITPETGRVRKVYMVKNIIRKSENFTLQLTWDTEKSARITTILNHTDGKSEIIKDEKLIWKF